MKFYVHNKTQKVYEFIGAGEMKNPTTKAWLPCVFYKDSLGAQFARESQEFHRKFTAESDLPHTMGQGVCKHCSHQWIAVAPTGAKELECPACHKMS